MCKFSQKLGFESGPPSISEQIESCKLIILGIRMLDL